MDLVNPETMREMDRRTIADIGVPGPVLMDRAAGGAVDHLLDFFDPAPGASIGILCGTGNNGGDGLAMATMLAHRGFAPSVVVLGGRDALSDDARCYFDIARRTVDDLEIAPDETSLASVLQDQPRCALWCDGLLGTGIDRPVGGRYRIAVEFLRDQPAPVMALDIPSGVEGRSGQVLGLAADAELTVSFGFSKVGQCLDPGRTIGGQLRVVDIGIPDEIRNAVGVDALGLDRTWLEQQLPARPRDLHKGGAGKTLHVGGRPETAGAIALSARAALVGGAGLISVATDHRSQPIIPTATPEIMARGIVDFSTGDIDEDAFGSAIEWADTVAVGPGLGTDATARRLLLQLLDAGPDRIVADADALNLAATDSEIASRLSADGDGRQLVLTPHPGEMSRLIDKSIDDILADPVVAATKLADDFRATAVLKTAATVVTTPDGRLAVNRSGNAGMATGGMGDALTGLITALFADTDDAFEAACRGVVTHGVAGDSAVEHTGLRGLTVRRLLDEIPAVWHDLEG